MISDLEQTGRIVFSVLFIYDDLLQRMGLRFSSVSSCGCSVACIPALGLFCQTIYVLTMICVGIPGYQCCVDLVD